MAEILTMESPVVLHDLAEVRELAAEIVSRVAAELATILPTIQVHHIGATSMPFGHTKGDVDVNLRVTSDEFQTVVDTLRAHYEVAQQENWTATFASFSSTRFPLPLGIQVNVLGSASDFLVALRDRMRSDPALLRAYDHVKVATAPLGATRYWQAKDEFLQQILERG